MAYPNTKLNENWYYGKHMMVDGKKCKRELITSLNNWRKFIDDLVKAIDMVPHGDLVIDRFGEGDDIGISACQLILTSSITVHTNDKAGDFYLDIFSCKDYDDQKVLNMVDKYFEPICINKNILLRI